MATLVELQARLDKLRQHRASPAAEVEFGDGRRVAYRNDGELAAAIADLQRQIAAFTTPPVTTILVAATKGLDA